MRIVRPHVPHGSALCCVCAVCGGGCIDALSGDRSIDPRGGMRTHAQGCAPPRFGFLKSKEASQLIASQTPPLAARTVSDLAHKLSIADSIKGHQPFNHPHHAKLMSVAPNIALRPSKGAYRVVAARLWRVVRSVFEVVAHARVRAFRRRAPAGRRPVGEWGPFRTPAT